MKLEWDKIGERLFKTGVSKPVLFVQKTNGYEKGVAWNGVTNIKTSPTGGESEALYANDIKWANIVSADELEGTIEAYMYPKEFSECIGNKEMSKGLIAGQQSRKNFALAYVRKISSDTEDLKGYEIVILYNLTAKPAEEEAKTINNKVEAATMSFSLSSTPVTINKAGFKPTSKIVINSLDVAATKMTKIEEKLFGSATGDSTILLPDEILTILEAVG